MRVLIVSHSYPPYGVAGVERVTEQTAAALAARGHAVTVLTRRPTPAPPSLALERDVTEGIPVIRIVGGDSTLGRYPGHETALERVFVRALAETRPEVVVLAHLLHHSAEYVHIARRWRIPVLLELHDYYVACPLAHLQRVSGERCDGPEGGRACAAHCFADQPDRTARWTLRSLEFRAALEAADCVIAPSGLVADYFAVPRGRATPIRVVGNGVSFAPSARAPRRRDGPLHLATVGAVTGHKGQHLVIDALRLARIGAVRYSILGTVTEESARELRTAAEDVPGLQLRISGSFAPRSLPALLADADVGVAPSLVPETYAIAAREMLACGIPVVASRLGALAEAVSDGVNGRLVEPGSASDLARVLIELNEDRGRVDALAAGIRPTDWVSSHDRAVVIEELLLELASAGVRDVEREARLVDVREAWQDR